MRPILFVVGLFLCVSLIAQYTSTRRRALLMASSGGGGSVQTPTAVRFTSFSSIRDDAVFSNAPSIMRLPHAELSQSGNALILCIASTNSGAANLAAALTVGDDQGGTWTKSCYGTNAAGTRAIWIFTSLNVSANIHIVQITNSGPQNLKWFTSALFEANNVASSSAVDGTNYSYGSSTTVSAGSITPSQSGDLFFQYAVKDTGGGGLTSWTVGSQANITWAFPGPPDTIDGTASQWGVYTSTGALNPQFTASPSIAYLSATIALKASAATQGSGRDSTMQIASVTHISVSNSVASPYVLQVPSVGNLQLIAFQGGDKAYVITNIVGGTWVEAFGASNVNRLSGSGSSQWLYRTNASSVATISNYFKTTTTGHGTFLIYDIVNASTDPYDFRTSDTNNQGAFANLVFPAGITPSAANGLVFMQEEHAFNTTSNFSATYLPDMQVWQGNNASGPSSADQNNGWGHYRNANNTTTVAPTWTYQNATALGPWTADMISFMPSGGVRLHPTFVQSSNAVVTSATSVTNTFPSNVGAGSLIVVGGRVGANGRTVTVSDDRTNTYTAAIPAVSDAVGDDFIIYYATNGAAAAVKTKVAVSGGAISIRIIAHEYTGVTSLDKTNSANFSSGTSPTSGNITNTTPRQVLFGLLLDGDQSTATATSPNANLWKSRQALAGNLYSQDYIVSPTNVYSSIFNIDDSTTHGRVGIASFK